jgi:hypothetical protein
MISTEQSNQQRRSPYNDYFHRVIKSAYGSSKLGRLTKKAGNCLPATVQRTSTKKVVSEQAAMATTKAAILNAEEHQKYERLYSVVFKAMIQVYNLIVVL